MAKTHRFSSQQVKLFVRSLMKEIGVDGWKLLVPRIQRALVAEYCLSVLTGQARESLEVEGMSALLADMLHEAKVEV